MVAYNTNKAPENTSRCFIRVWFSSFFYIMPSSP